MGLFRDVGRRVERFKRQVEEVAQDESTFRCTACGEAFYTAHDTCPECGEPAVEPIDPPAAEPEKAADPSADASDGAPAEDRSDG